MFSGLVTYYIEGDAAQRGHMMQEVLGKAQRAWAVRGNLFSFLLPWEKIMAQLSKCFLTGDFREWPLDQQTVSEIVRVRIVRAVQQATVKYRELTVRSAVVKYMANIYMERHIKDLGQHPHVLKLLQVPTEGRQVDAEDSEGRLRAHIEARVDAEYPKATFGSPEGAIPQPILEMIRAQEEECSPDIFAFDMKQTTMPDTPCRGPDLFEGMRPSIVTDEGDTRGTFTKESIAEAAMADKVNIIDVPVSHTFENQFTSQYSSRVFPLALNYDCGWGRLPQIIR